MKKLFIAGLTVLAVNLNIGNNYAYASVGTNSDNKTLTQLEIAAKVSGIKIYLHPQNEKILQVSHQEMNDQMAKEIIDRWKKQNNKFKNLEFKMISFENNSGNKWVYFFKNKK